MTVDAQAPQQLPDLAELGMTVREEHEIPDRLPHLVERVRELLDTVARTDACDAELDQAAEAVQSATRLLSSSLRGTGTMVRRQVDGAVRYNTLANAVTGQTNPIAPPLRLEDDGEGVSATLTLGAAYEGPPGCVHGGWVAALLDQAVGEAAWRRGAVVMTGRLEVDYRSPTPLEAPLQISARVETEEPRKLRIVGEIHAHGTLTAHTRAVMVRIWPPKEG
jgi:acyl-coenzyme A thioesterase PaaI-like protein